MKKVFIFLTFIVLSFPCMAQGKWSIALHGGAGAMSRDRISPEREQRYKQGLQRALDIGVAILEKGGTSLDAVEAVVVYLEDCPLFNAGRGAVFTADNRNELDAAIMSGIDLDAGAVINVGDIKNPIKAAKAVMDNSPHVILTGIGASKFAREQGLEMVDSGYFRVSKDELAMVEMFDKDKNEKFGTVGCVALDQHGSLAAATSTGGMSGKKYGRVGDVPIIGAGTYASNTSCAVSGTGHGEFFIRYTVASDIARLMEYKGMSVQEAAGEVIHKKMNNLKGYSGGGVICVDKDGSIALEFSTNGMHRGWAKSTGESVVAVFKD
ncbi:MAG: isoaspartyl peptidase/L-asparaginase [Prevotellaceae bacterium]|jgi:beta-aspartyl-peptidase (threonine type)|nr:isoaspartyl peptidase/L-asparaginase [Prevotellaceae bacterium]